MLQNASGAVNVCAVRRVRDKKRALKRKPPCAAADTTQGGVLVGFYKGTVTSAWGDFPVPRRSQHKEPFPVFCEKTIRNLLW